MAISDRNMKLMPIIALLLATYIVQATSQASSAVPQAFPATRVGGSGQGCPTEEEWAAARNEVLQEVYAQIVEQFGVTPSPLPGERADFPASSCQQIAELSPDSLPGNYWIIAPNGSAVQVDCNMNGSNTTSAMATSTTTLDQSTITSLQPTPTVTTQELTPISLQPTPTVTPDTAIGQTEESPASSCQQVAELDPSRPSGFYWVRSSNGTAVSVYCDMTRECCGTTGGWTRVAFLNMTDPGHQCPPAWREITRSEEPRRTCGRTGSGDGCSAALFPSRGVQYNRVCGRVIGYQYGHPTAFDTDRSTHDIDGDYLDGVSITHGNPRQHIWSFAAAPEESSSISVIWQCPCANTAAIVAVPPFVGQDYFCETGTDTYTYQGYIFYADDPLWDGENCGPVTSACCEFNNPPWFCKQLPEPTTDDIEVRICGLETLSDQDTPIQLIEIYTTYIA